ncbi:hypothetical protein CRG98_037687 [Punica granatum]|uniref:Reverse transcriptase Ty1/copia-type domain-containing protein n=1 Tax=Punica granatum TaxID=22663 RepID=A0A2I0ID68_PUNGR|nr:hypothetical protein CRG98_037687 [Punica granatum]
MGKIRLNGEYQLGQVPNMSDERDAVAHQGSDQGPSAFDMDLSPPSASGVEQSPRSADSDESQQSPLINTECSGNFEPEEAVRSSPKPIRNRRPPAWQKGYDCRLAAIKPPPPTAHTDSKIPAGLVPAGSNKVCCLQKSLYGLRQASRNWFAKFSIALKSYGFIQSSADYSLFTFNKDGIILVVLVYVDDLILTGNDITHCAKFKQYLDDCFRIKDLGKLK